MKCINDCSRVDEVTVESCRINRLLYAHDLALLAFSDRGFQHAATEPGHLHHSALTRPSSADARRLKSRYPFVPAAQHLISSSDSNNIRAAQWADHQWNAEWADNPTFLRIFTPYTGTHPPE